VSSRLLEFELWARLNARALGASHAEAARRLVERLAILELVPNVLARALEPFPAPVRTLDAIHLTSMEFLRGRGTAVELATYDERLRTGARSVGIPPARVRAVVGPGPDPRRGKGQVQPGQEVLINGAGGGVGDRPPAGSVRLRAGDPPR